MSRVRSGSTCAFLAALAATTTTARAEDAPSRIAARKMYERLVGSPALDEEHGAFADVEAALAARKPFDAALAATREPGFLDVTVRALVAPLSNRTENPYVPLNDFQATWIGVVRDDLDARLLLTGNVLYTGRSDALPGGAALPAYSVAGNDHYDRLDAADVSLAAALERHTQPFAEEQTAGLLTTRAWGEAHYNQGTNRRAVEKSIQVFLCTPIAVWKQPGLPDTRVRRDVDRAPAGDPGTYKSTCRQCHTGMDAFAGAFAKLDFAAGALSYYPGSRVVPKYNQHIDVYPQGFVTVDDSWMNVLGATSVLGIAPDARGKGVRSFGAALAAAPAFASCAVERTYRAVCAKEVATLAADERAALAQAFVASGYRYRDLFARVASHPSCLGDTP